LADNSARCWGGDDSGQTTVPAITGGWKALTAGDRQTCGVLLADNSARCWGAETYVPKP
jgi:hypothetical protein